MEEINIRQCGRFVVISPSINVYIHLSDVCGYVYKRIGTHVYTGVYTEESYAHMYIRTHVYTMCIDVHNFWHTHLYI